MTHAKILNETIWDIAPKVRVHYTGNTKLPLNHKMDEPHTLLHTPLHKKREGEGERERSRGGCCLTD